MEIMTLLQQHRVLINCVFHQHKEESIYKSHLLCSRTCMFIDLTADQLLMIFSSSSTFCKRLPSHTGQGQACTRITRLVGCSFVCLSPCRKWPNTQKNGCWLPPSDHIQSKTLFQTRQDQEKGMNGPACLLHSWRWVLLFELSLLIRMLKCLWCYQLDDGAIAVKVVCKGMLQKHHFAISTMQFALCSRAQG